MKLKIPTWIDPPKSSSVAAGISYWFFAFLCIPFLILLILSGPDSSSQHAWIDIAYHGINFLAALVIFFPYLKESAFTLRFEWKKCLITAVICAVAVTAVKIAISLLSIFLDNWLLFALSDGMLITTEAELLLLPTTLAVEQPIWGTLCLVLLTPLTVSCLFYACIFAPICSNRPWLAYIVTIVTLFIPRLLLVFCFWSFKEQIIIYLVQLPVHMLACLAYHKTNTIWTPIAVHVISNLIFVIISVILVLFYY